jgi:hypothetical protein
MMLIGGYLTITRLLINLGANLNHQDRINGWTALMQVWNAVTFLAESMAGHWTALLMQARNVLGYPLHLSSAFVDSTKTKACVER